MKVYFLELILTKKCNKSCYYCNVHEMTKYKDFKIELDLDFLKYILNYIPKNTMIEFCGGEPGLISNLDDAFSIVYYHKNVKAVQIMSNGLVRLSDYDWLEKENVWYCEHLIDEIDGTNIKKFYNNLNFIEKPRWRYVVVTTHKTTYSLFMNYDYFKKLGFFRDMFWYKIMNPKTHGVGPFVILLEALFKRLEKENYIDSKFTLKRINTIKGKDLNAQTEKRLCGFNSPQPTIDFETKELVHCGAYLSDSKRIDYDPTDFLKHLHCQLFKPQWYCETCYIYSDNQMKSIISCKKGEFYNMEV